MTGAPTDCTFYTVADASYFPGAVALLNSLALVGETEPLVVYDCGLTRDQRLRLQTAATVLPPGRCRHPLLAKSEGPRQRPAAGVLAIVDADVIAVRPLQPLITRAAQGSVVAFADDQPDRFFSEWGQALGIDNLHRHPYVNAGLLVLPGDLAPRLLACVAELLGSVDFSRSRGFGPGTMAEPFRLSDQDCWNAALAAIVAPERLIVLDHALAPFQPWEPVKLEDRATLRCRVADGRQPYLLHHIDHKPWLRGMPPSAYSALLARVLNGDDVPVPLKLDLPVWGTRATRGVWRATALTRAAPASIRRRSGARTR